jgi:hypothetical protein
LAGVSRLIRHAPINFLRFEDLLAVGKSDADALADRVIIFALKRQNVGQKGLGTLVHRVHRLLVAVISPKSAKLRLRGGSGVYRERLDRLLKQSYPNSR